MTSTANCNGPRTDSHAGRLRVLSIQELSVGHGTHLRLMRDCFAGSACDLDTFWFNDEREWWVRLFNRIASQEIPGRWVRQRNLDLQRFRIELGAGLLGRRLAKRKMARAREMGRDYDVLHFHTQIGAWGSLVIMRQIPTVLTGDMTATQFAREAAQPSWRWSYAPSVRREKLVFSAARRILFWSQWAARSAIEDEGVAPEKVAVLHPGVDIARFSLPEKKKRAQGEPVRLLFVGGEWNRKGVPELLEVFSRDLPRNAELDLVTAKGAGISHPRVRVHHGVQAYSPEWMDLYSQADLFVLPTRSEAFGLVLTEAMAAGLPVVATRLNAIPEIVEHGRSGLLVPPGDQRALAEALNTLIADCAMRRAMGARGRHLAETKFDARENFRRLEQVFREVARDG